LDDNEVFKEFKVSCVLCLLMDSRVADSYVVVEVVWTQGDSSVPDVMCWGDYYHAFCVSTGSSRLYLEPHVLTFKPHFEKNMCTDLSFPFPLLSLFF